MSEKILRPAHYDGFGLDCDPLDVMEALGIAEGFARGNVLKLAWRMGEKGEEQSDREKLAFYALLLAYGREVADEAIRRAREIAVRLPDPFEGVEPAASSASPDEATEETAAPPEGLLVPPASNPRVLAAPDYGMAGLRHWRGDP